MPTIRRAFEGRKSFSVSRQPISFSGVNGLIDMTGGGGSVAGDGALRVAAAYIACTLLADEVASLPLKIVAKDDESRRPVDPPGLQPLWDHPNPDQTLFSWMNTNTLSLSLHGMSVNMLGWRNNGQLGVMWPQVPQDCALERLDDGGLRLRVAGSGELSNHPDQRPEFMLVPLYTLPGRIEPISPVRYAAELLGLGATYQKVASNLAGGGFNPAAIVTFDDPVDPEDAKAISKALARTHGGANAGKEPAVFGGKGVKVEKLGMSMVDAEFLATYEKVFEVTMAIWRVPPTVAGMVNKPSSWGTGIAEFSRGLERFTLRPLVLRFQAAFEACLTRWVDPNLQARFKFDAMLAASPKDRAEIQRLALINGLTSQERILAQNDEPPFGPDETVFSALSQATEEDRELERLKKRASAAAELIKAGADPASAYAAVGLNVTQAAAPPLEPPKSLPEPEAKSQPIDLTVNVDLPAVSITNEAQPAPEAAVRKVRKQIKRDTEGNIAEIVETEE